jgi:hypothetical protein
MPGAEAAAAGAAAARRLREHEEEEELTTFTTDPMGDLEYKILRSATGVFGDPAKFRAALEEEARAGWDLMEKLDDKRVRLRRPISCRAKDGELSQDPYRIQVGMSEGAQAVLIFLGVITGVFLVIGIVGTIIALLVKNR